MQLFFLTFEYSNGVKRMKGIGISVVVSDIVHSKSAKSAHELDVRQSECQQKLAPAVMQITTRDAEAIWKNSARSYQTHFDFENSNVGCGGRAAFLSFCEINFYHSFP